MPGLFYACSYDNEWYLVVTNYVLVENCDHAVTHLVHLRDQYPGLGTQTLASKNHFSSFLFSVVFQ